MGKNIVFFCSHIYREANSCTDKLANFGVSSRDSHTWWNSIPSFVKEEFFRNRFNLPNCP
ncbi:hypothetical protein GYH30_016102 [Glycine max]|uniref:RNase H type-1 domain-containing protein n=1 Tax=Glycine max TaxID=3847 RepID=K7KX14_SOYBN|nr:hypothetical protein GYH30_016102 [Glycine max]